MGRAVSASWAGVNLTVGLLLTFMAPRLSSSIAFPLSVGYLLALAIALVVSQAREPKVDVQPKQALLFVAGLSAITALTVAVFFSNQIGTALQLVVSTWGVIQAALLFMAARKSAHKSNEVRDLYIVSAVSAGMAVALYVPTTNLRDQLGYLSAYLLITGVLHAISAATPSK